MIYLVGDKKYELRYSELKADFERYSAMSDDDFLASLPQIIHFAVMIGYLKELPSSCLLADNGIIHELVHLLDGTDADLAEVRELFDTVLRLV